MSVILSRYVRMTCSMMNEFGCSVQGAGNGCWVVPRSGYNRISVSEGGSDGDHQHEDDFTELYSSGASPAARRTSTYTIEPDASSATYFLAMAAVTGAFVLVNPALKHMAWVLK